MAATHIIRTIDTMPRNGWLAPDGTLWHVEDYDHANVAYDSLGDDTYGDRLEERGWLHISINRSLYVSCTHPRFTNPQLDTLWDIYSARPEHPIAWQQQAIAQLRRLFNITVQE